MAMAEAVIVISAQSGVFWRQREHIRWKGPYLRLNLWTAPVVGDDYFEVWVRRVAPKASTAFFRRLKRLYVMNSTETRGSSDWGHQPRSSQFLGNRRLVWDLSAELAP